MISREEKNKELEQEIKKEEAINTSKKILKILFILILVFSLCFIYMYFVGIKGIKTHEYIIKNDSLPDTFEGIKVLHFSDLLYGTTINASEIDYLEEEIKLIKPDIVFFTGNLISDKYAIKEDEIKKLNNFFKNIPYTIGKYAVYGELDNQNFDLIMENTNFDILNNEIIDIYNNSNLNITIVGLNNKDEKELIIDKENMIISLIHNYDNYSNYNIKSNLIFAGSNLGGEINLFGLALLGNNKYTKSYYKENNTQIYISNGLGSIHHVRLFNHPSINIYRLYK